MSRLPALCLLLALAAPAGSAAPANGGSSSIWRGFEALDLGGRRWTAAELEGRVVLLDFWATWCAPCLAEIPTLREASERFGPRGLLLLGVSMDRGGRRQLAGFLRRQAIDWPQLHDGRGFAGPVARRFRVDRVPRTLLVDRAGRLVAVDLPGDALLAALPALLDDKPGRVAPARPGRPAGLAPARVPV